MSVSAFDTTPPAWALDAIRRADDILDEALTDISLETRWLDRSVGRVWRRRVEVEWLEIRMESGELDLVTGSRRAVLESGDPLGDGVFARDRDRRWSLVSWSSRLAG